VKRFPQDLSWEEIAALVETSDKVFDHTMKTPAMLTAQMKVEEDMGVVGFAAWRVLLTFFPQDKVPKILGEFFIQGEKIRREE